MYMHHAPNWQTSIVCVINVIIHTIPHEIRVEFKFKLKFIGVCCCNAATKHFMVWIVMPTFYCNYFLLGTRGPLTLGGSLDFAYPAYPIVTPLIVCQKASQIQRIVSMIVGLQERRARESQRVALSHAVKDRSSRLNAGPRTYLQSSVSGGI